MRTSFVMQQSVCAGQSVVCAVIFSCCNFADNPSSTMGNSRSVQLETDDIEEISEETGFTRPQIERLHERFTGLDKGSHQTRKDKK